MFLSFTNAKKARKTVYKLRLQVNCNSLFYSSLTIHVSCHSSSTEYTVTVNDSRNAQCRCACQVHRPTQCNKMSFTFCWINCTGHGFGWRGSQWQLGVLRERKLRRGVGALWRVRIYCVKRHTISYQALCCNVNGSGKVIVHPRPAADQHQNHF